MDEKQEKAYSPKEMRITLDIGDSTLRKWCIALENNGYKFIRSEQNRRLFIESDVVMFRHFQNLIKQHNMQLDNAAKLVVDRFGIGAFETGTGAVLAEREQEQRDLERSNDELNKQLLEHIERQEAFNQELIKRLDEQQKYIDKRLNKQDEKLEARDQRLMEALNQSMEQQKLIAAAQEEERKKGFFSRWFGK